VVLTFHDGVDAGAMVTVVGTVATKAVELYSESLGPALKGDYEYPWFNT
jgi:hypothetical protein